MGTFHYAAKKTMALRCRVFLPPKLCRQKLCRVHKKLCRVFKNLCLLDKLCPLYIVLLGVGAAVGVGMAVVVAVAVDKLTKHMGLDVWLAEKTSTYIYLHIHILINTFYLAINRIYS